MKRTTCRSPYVSYTKFTNHVKSKGFSHVNTAFSSGYIKAAADHCKVEPYSGVYGDGFKVYCHNPSVVQRGTIVEYWTKESV